MTVHIIKLFPASVALDITLVFPHYLQLWNSNRKGLLLFLVDLKKFNFRPIIWCHHILYIMLMDYCSSTKESLILTAWSCPCPWASIVLGRVLVNIRELQNTHLIRHTHRQNVVCILCNNAIQSVSTLSASISPSGETHYDQINLKIYFKVVTLSVCSFLLDGKNYAIDIFPVSAW